MRGKKNTARQSLERGEASFKIGCNSRICLVASKHVIKRGDAADAYDVIVFSTVHYPGRPGRIALGVSRCQVCRHLLSTEFNRIAIIHDPIHLHWRKRQRVTKPEIAMTAAFQQFRVRAQRCDLCSGQLL